MFVEKRKKVRDTLKIGTHRKVRERDRACVHVYVLVHVTSEAMAKSSYGRLLGGLGSGVIPLRELSL